MIGRERKNWTLDMTKAGCNVATTGKPLRMLNSAKLARYTMSRNEKEDPR